MTRSLTLIDSSVIDLTTIDRILQSVVFFADAVAIRASFEIPASYRKDSHMINRRISELHEAGLLKFWSHEYEVDDAGHVPAGTAPQHRRPADIIIPQGSLQENLSSMDEVMQSIREEAYRTAGTGSSPLRQGHAEIVALRNCLASLVISSELRQDGLLTNPAAHTHLVRNLRTPAPPRFDETVVKELVAQLGVGSLNQLSIEQVVESRRYNADFRTLIDQSLIAVARGFDPTLTPEATAKELVNRYRATISEFARPQVAGQVMQEVVWDVLGAAIPSTMVFKYGLRALKWRKTMKESKPFLLLMHLERSLTHRGHSRALPHS